MNDQNPTPDNGAATIASADAIRTANAVRDAFSMGWSIQELRSRVLLEVPDEQPVDNAKSSTSATGDATKATAVNVTDVNATSAITTSANATAVKTTAVNATSSNGSAAHPSALSDILSVLKMIFPSVLSPSSQAQGGQSSFNKSLARTSQWRSLFVRIAATHCICFPKSTTENTPYDPAPTPSLESRLPYLYPSTGPDYALIGIKGVGNDNIGDAALANFTLYDTVRRSLNCLTLLHTRPEESLVPDIICAYQQQIVASVFSRPLVPDDTAASDVTVIKQGTTVVQQSLEEEATLILHAYMSETAVGPSPDELNAAMRILSFLTIRFLDSWDGFLRENFYVGGQLKNNELELLAYEAGRSLAALSYGTSLVTSPLERACRQNPGNKDKLDALATAWTNIFEDVLINTIQRQISALGPSLDEGYYAFKNIHRPAPGEKPGPDIPSRGIHALTYNLEYWKRTITWMYQPSSDVTIEMWQELRQALVAQSGIWQSLILGEQTLRSFSTGSVTKKIINDLMVDFENAMREQSGNTLNRYRTPLIVGAVVLLVILGGGLVLLALTGQLQSVTAVIGLVVGSVVTFVSAALTRVGSVFSPATNGKSSTASTSTNASSVEQRLSGILGATEATAISIFQNAYNQILLEFDDLNHYVAISYPLVDFFLTMAPQMQQGQVNLPVNQVIKDADIFLTQIVWTSEEQQEEVKQIARTAFGPLALLFTPSAKQEQQGPPATQKGK